MGLAAAWRQGQTDEALEEYKRIERAWSGFPGPIIRRGELLETLGQERAALREYRAAADLTTAMPTPISFWVCLSAP